MVLQNPTIDFAVFEVARGGILREGLGYHRNDVAVVLNVTGDHLGLGGIHSIRQLAEVKRVIVEAVPRDGVAVLNADDALVAAMARHCSGSVVYFSTDPEHERLKFQAARGRRAVTLEQGRKGEMIVLRQGRKSMSLVWTHLLPSTFEGRARMNVQRPGRRRGVLGCGRAPPRHPGRGLRSFTTSIYIRAPGRLNLFDLDGVKVVVDYAHNPAGLVRPFGDFVEADDLRAPSPGPPGQPSWTANLKVAVVATPGDRRDEDMRRARARGGPVPWTR